MTVVAAASFRPEPADLAEIAQLAIVLNRCDIAELLVDAAYDVINGLPYQAIYDLMVQLRWSAWSEGKKAALTAAQIRLLHAQPNR